MARPEHPGAHRRRGAHDAGSLLKKLVGLLLLLSGTLAFGFWLYFGPFNDAGNPSGSAASHFGTLSPGARLPSEAQCAGWVTALSLPETRPANKTFNHVAGNAVGALFPASDDPKANADLAPRIDGGFAGTTAQVLRWAACKWGIDQEIVAAQAAVESWWRQSALGDWGTDPAACPPGNGLGADGMPGKCPQSYGILQNRYSFETSSWPGIALSTSMNADTAYGIWRACFEGYELWLNDVEHVGAYNAGDVWGCIGRWYAGRWHTAPAEQYIAKVRDYLSRRVWEQPSFVDG